MPKIERKKTSTLAYTLAVTGYLPISSYRTYKHCKSFMACFESLEVRDESPRQGNFKSFISHNVIRSHPVKRVLCRDETDSQLRNVAARSDRGDLFPCVLTLWFLNRSLTINYKKRRLEEPEVGSIPCVFCEQSEAWP